MPCQQRHVAGNSFFDTSFVFPVNISSILPWIVLPDAEKKDNTCKEWLSTLYADGKQLPNSGFIKGKGTLR